MPITLPGFLATLAFALGWSLGKLARMRPKTRKDSRAIHLKTPAPGFLGPS